MMANALFFPPCFSTQKQSKHFVEHPLFTCSDRNFFMLFETKCFLFNSHTHSHSDERAAESNLGFSISAQGNIGM